MVRTHTDLEVYQLAFDLAMQVFRLTGQFPKEETYSLTDQVRRSSRSVCANLAEAWRKRRYEAAFVSKLNDAETEAVETQVWRQFAVECEYFTRDAAASLYKEYDKLIGMAIAMIRNPGPWIPKRT